MLCFTEFLLVIIFFFLWDEKIDNFTIAFVSQPNFSTLTVLMIIKYFAEMKQDKRYKKTLQSIFLVYDWYNSLSFYIFTVYFNHRHTNRKLLFVWLNFNIALRPLKLPFETKVFFIHITADISEDQKYLIEQMFAQNQ